MLFIFFRLKGIKTDKERKGEMQVEPKMTFFFKVDWKARQKSGKDKATEFKRIALTFPLHQSKANIEKAHRQS